jgi:hypothetical protein
VHSSGELGTLSVSRLDEAVWLATTSFVDSENGRALPARELQPSAFFMHYMESFMERALERWNEARAWFSEGKVISGYAEEEY